MSTQQLLKNTKPYLHQLTNPLLAFVLAPVSYSFLGFVMAFKSQLPISYFGWFIGFLFLFLLHLQELLYEKLYRMKRQAQLLTIGLSTVIVLLPVLYFLLTYNMRLALIGVLVVLINATYLLRLHSKNSIYLYHIILNGLAKFAIGNFLMYYMMVRQIPQSIFELMLTFSVIGMGILHMKQLMHQRTHKASGEHSTVTMIASVVFNFCWLLGVLLTIAVTHVHYTIIGIVFLLLTMVIPVFYHLRIKKSMHPNRVVVYLQWYAIVTSFIFAIFYHL